MLAWSCGGGVVVGLCGGSAVVWCGVMVCCGAVVLWCGGVAVCW